MNTDIIVLDHLANAIEHNRYYLHHSLCLLENIDPLEIIDHCWVIVASFHRLMKQFHRVLVVIVVLTRYDSLFELLLDYSMLHLLAKLRIYK